MKKINVLIVDDEEIVVAGIKKGLEENPIYTIKTALGGRLAIGFCAKEFFDVVLLDLVMPEMNGVETCRKIIKISPDSKILLISGFPQEVEKYQWDFINAGGLDVFLRKPLLAGEISETIIKVLNR